MNARTLIMAASLLSSLARCGDVRAPEQSAAQEAAPASSAVDALAPAQPAPVVPRPEPAADPVAEPAPHKQPPAMPVSGDLLAYAKSCRDRSKRALREEDWETALRSGDARTLRFTAPVQVELGRLRREVDALLVPRTGPFEGAVLARKGEVIFSPFIRCNPALLDP